MGARDSIVAIGITPTYMDRAVKEILGISIRSKKVVVTTKAQDTLIAKNIRIESQNLFNAFGAHIQSKIVKAFATHSDPSSGQKWKKLSREAIKLREELQMSYSRQYVDSGFKGREKKVKYMPPNVKPLYLTGKLYEVATGARLKNLAGGLGKQTAGNISKDGIKLTIYAGYNPKGPIQFGSYIWYLDGPKVRHNEGFSEYFVNTLGDGTETERAQYPVPARPYVPKFSNQFLSAWVRANIAKRYRKAFIATQNGSNSIIESAVINLAKMGKDF
jgi:hypothetical protein